MKDCIHIVYKSGTQREIFETVFEGTRLTLIGHFHEIVDRKRKNEPDYLAGRFYTTLDNIESVSVNKN